MASTTSCSRSTRRSSDSNYSTNSTRSFRLADSGVYDGSTVTASAAVASPTTTLSSTMLSGSLTTTVSNGTSTSQSSNVSSSIRRKMSLVETNLNSQYYNDLSNQKILRKNKYIQELTINKLNFKSIQVVGREKEIKTIHSCIDRSIRNSNDHDDGDDRQISHNNNGGNNIEGQDNLSLHRRKKELVLIKGFSGIGKSVLAQQAKDYVLGLENGIVGTGKFGINNNDHPYSGIAAAFGEILTRISHKQLQDQKHSDTDKISKMGDNIVRQIGAHGVLSSLIPELDQIMPYSAAPGLTVPVNERYDHSADLERVKYGLRVVTREICREFAPVVLILDDLQWCDIKSVDVIDFLINDTQNLYGLTIIGLYRSDEVDHHHILPGRIESWKEQIDMCNVTEINLSGLQNNDVSRIIMSLLSIDDENSIRQLSDICFRRTFGNPFFLIKFMEMLEQEGLLTYNLGTLKWTWNDDTLENMTMSTENVVTILQTRINKLPRPHQKLLQFAAYLGAYFRPFPLEQVWFAHTSINDDDRNENILDMLNELTSEKLLEEYPSEHSYRFVHDKIQEAAIACSDFAIEPNFRAEIGLILYDKLEKSELESMLFTVVDLVNTSEGTKPNLEHAKLNLRAAQKARSLSAFEAAEGYVTRSIILLPEDRWTSHREFTLNVFSLGTELEAALGRDVVMDELAAEVLAQSDLSPLEKAPIYVSKTEKLCNVDLDYAATIELSLLALKELGCHIPSGSISLPLFALRRFYRTVNRAKNTSISQFEAPRLMTEPKLQSAMLFLSQLFYAGYFLSRQFLLLASAAEMVRLTLDHGISSFSGQAYSSLAMIVNAVTGDTKTGSYLAETGLLIQEATTSKYTQSQTLFLSHTYVLSWSKPITSAIPSLATGYAIGMQTGNVTYALWNLQGWKMFMKYLVGKPLNQIVPHIPSAVAQIEELNYNDQSLVSRMWWQMFLTLTGESDDPLMLKGDAFDVDDHPNVTPLQVLLLDFLQSELFLFLGCYDIAATSALSRDESFSKCFSGHALVMIETFHRGVALYAMARRTKERRYRIAAERVRKTVAKWSKRGNPNVKHYHWMLSAENAVLRRNYRVAESFYKQAITLAGKTGHLHHAALFNERYAEFLREIMQDHDESKYRMLEAIRWYREWGAIPAVERIEEFLKNSSSQVFK